MGASPRESDRGRGRGMLCTGRRPRVQAGAKAGIARSASIRAVTMPESEARDNRKSAWVPKEPRKSAQRLFPTMAEAVQRVERWGFGRLGTVDVETAEAGRMARQEAKQPRGSNWRDRVSAFWPVSSDFSWVSKMGNQFGAKSRCMRAQKRLLATAVGSVKMTGVGGCSGGRVVRSTRNTGSDNSDRQAPATAEC
jgi:hypothetical protein